MTLGEAWTRMPVIVRAVVTGLLVTAVVTVPWGILASANLKHWSAVPWSAPPAGLLLWLYWRVLKGNALGASAAQSLRAKPLSAGIWGMSLFAGVIGLGAVLAFQPVVARLTALPPEHQASDLPEMPAATLLVLVLMGSLVAGIGEDAGFRGYMQGMIERRHGPVIAILVSGTVFSLSHFSHRRVGFGHLPIYIAISGVYGMLAYLTGSIMPGLVLHAAGDMLEGFLLVLSGRSSAAAPLSQSGTDMPFGVLCGWAVLWILGAVWAYRALANEVRTETDFLDPPRDGTPNRMLR